MLITGVIRDQKKCENMLGPSDDFITDEFALNKDFNKLYLATMNQL